MSPNMGSYGTQVKRNKNQNQFVLVLPCLRFSWFNHRYLWFMLAASGVWDLLFLCWLYILLCLSLCFCSEFHFSAKESKFTLLLGPCYSAESQQRETMMLLGGAFTHILCEGFIMHIYNLPRIWPLNLVWRTRIRSNKLFLGFFAKAH